MLGFNNQPYQPWVHSLQGVPTRLPPQEPGTPPGQATDSRHLKICVAKQTGGLSGADFVVKKMECLRLKPKAPNLIPALHLLTFCCQASRGLSFVLKKPSTICGTNSSPNSLVPLYKLALEWRLQRLLGNWDNTWSLLKQPCSQRSIWVSSLQPQRSHIRKKWAGHALSAFHAIHTWSRQVSCGRNRRNTHVVECQMIPAFWEACFLRGKLQ